jgi:hypothetical protein
MRPSKSELSFESLEQRRLLSATHFELEPNELPETAIVAAPAQDGWVQLIGEAHGGDVDRYRFQAPEGGRVSAELLGPREDAPVATVYDQGIELLRTNSYYGARSGEFRVQGGGEYEIEVHGQGNDQQGYALQLHYRPFDGDVNNDRHVGLDDFGLLKERFGRPGPDRQGDLNLDDRVDLSDFSLLKRDYGKDLSDDTPPLPGTYDSPSDDTPAGAVSFSLDESGHAILRGVATGPDERDFFVFVAPSTATLQVAVSSPNGNLAALEIENAASEAIFETEPNDGVNAGQFAVIAGQSYVLRLKSPNAGDAEYVVELGPAVDNGGGGGGGNGGGGGQVSQDYQELEPNDRPNQALPFALAQNQAARLLGVAADADDQDFFRFQAPASGPVHVTVTSPNGHLAALEIEDQNSNEVFETEPNDGQNSGTFQAVAGQTYFVRLRTPDQAAAEYAVDLAMTALFG